MSHHYWGPNIGFPRGDARLDLTDLFAFPKPREPNKSILILGKLLPDLLRYDPKRPASFPENGRALVDDVSDLFLAVMTNGKVTGDQVGPHNDFLDEFPYLGPPHILRSK
jgi:hypothetical protein